MDQNIDDLFKKTITENENYYSEGAKASRDKILLGVNDNLNSKRRYGFVFWLSAASVALLIGFSFFYGYQINMKEGQIAALNKKINDFNPVVKHDTVIIVNHEESTSLSPTLMNNTTTQTIVANNIIPKQIIRTRVDTFRVLIKDTVFVKEQPLVNPTLIANSTISKKDSLPFKEKQLNKAIAKNVKRLPEAPIAFSFEDESDRKSKKKLKIKFGSRDTPANVEYNSLAFEKNFNH